MRYTVLGKTGLNVSRIGFGGIPIRRLSREEAAAIVRRAVDLGITFFDTARAYGDSEEKIGEGLAGRRNAVVVATKSLARTKREMAADVDESLRRLRTDYIDLYQLHNVHSDALWRQVMAPDGALEALREARAAGKIRHIGITTHNRDVALQALPTGQFETLMVAFSYLEPEAAEQVLPLCRDLNVAFINMKPFAGGMLDTPEQCLKWVLGQGATVVIPGVGSLAELAQDAAVADLDWTLSAADLVLMERIKAEAGKSFCRACDYCQPCSSDIPISNVLRSPSLLKRMGPSYLGIGQLDRMTAWVESCTECGDCMSRCPYDLPIPDLLRQRLEELRSALAAKH